MELRFLNQEDPPKRCPAAHFPLESNFCEMTKIVKSLYGSAHNFVNCPLDGRQPTAAFNDATIAASSRHFRDQGSRQLDISHGELAVVKVKPCINNTIDSN